jgi:hypothetical protein
MAARTYSRTGVKGEKISTGASSGGEQQTATEVTTATEDKAAPASAAAVAGYYIKSVTADSAHNDVKRVAGGEEQLAAHNGANSTGSNDA